MPASAGRRREWERLQAGHRALSQRLGGVAADAKAAGELAASVQRRLPDGGGHCAAALRAGLSQLLHSIAASTKAASKLAASVQRRLAEELEEQRKAREEEEDGACDAELASVLASAERLSLHLLLEPDGGRPAIDLPLDATVADLRAAVHSAGGPVPPLQVLAVGGERLMHLGRTLLSDTRLIRPDVCVTVRRRDPRRRCVDVSDGGRMVALLESGEVWCSAERFRVAAAPRQADEPVRRWVLHADDVWRYEAATACFGDLGNVVSVHCGSRFVAVVADGQLHMILPAAWRDAWQQELQRLRETYVVCFSISFHGALLGLENVTDKLAAVDSDGQLWLFDKAGTTVPAVLRRRAAAVSVSSGMAVVLTTDGQVCTLSHYWPEEPNWVHLGGRPAVAVSAGSGHGAALLDDGSVRCFGDNTYGQCNVPSGLRDVVSVECNEVSTFAVLSDGGISWWGRRQHWPEEPFSPHFGAGCCTAVAAGVHSLVTVSADSRLARYWSGAGEQPLAAQPSGRLASG